MFGSFLSLLCPVGCSPLLSFLTVWNGFGIRNAQTNVKAQSLLSFVCSTRVQGFGQGEHTNKTQSTKQQICLSSISLCPFYPPFRRSWFLRSYFRLLFLLSFAGPSHQGLERRPWRSPDLQHEGGKQLSPLKWVLWVSSCPLLPSGPSWSRSR